MSDNNQPKKNNWRGRGRGGKGFYGRPFPFEKKKLDPGKLYCLCY